MRAGAWILGAATALAIAAAPAAAVAPGSGWGPDVRLGSSVDASEPALAAMSLDDDAIVGWTRAGAPAARVRVRHGPWGRWSATLSLGGGSLVGLAMDRDGDALAVRRPGLGPPRATRLRRNGTAVTSRIGTAGTVASVLAVTLRQDGRAVALVRRPGGAAVGYLVQETPAATWARRGPDLPVPAGVALSVAVNRAGQAVVAWVDPVARRSIPAATRYSLGGQWKAFPAGLPGLPPPGPIVRSPIAAMGDDGSAAVTWTVGSSDPFLTPDRGAGAIVRTGFGPTADASPLPVFGPTAGVAVSSTGTAMISWTDPLGGDLWASRFSPVGPTWPIGVRLLADANRLEEGAFAIAPVGSRHGPVLVEASLETGPGPDGHVAFARDSRGAPWGAPHRLTFTRGTPVVVAGDTAGLIALAVDDDGTLVVTPYDRLPVRRGSAHAGSAVGWS